MLKIIRKTNGREKLKLVTKSNWKRFCPFSFSKLFKRILLMIIFYIFIGFFDQPISLGDSNDNYNNFKSEKFIIYSKEELKNLEQKIIWEVNDYIKKYGSESKISADTLVKICNRYNFNISFVLAQGHVESHFGTKGIATNTHSVFNVGTYDDGTILHIYDNPNESIEPYIILLKEKYLIGNKTIEDLMCKDGYVNYKGKRYASYKYYEQKLKELYNYIQETTSIDSLQNIYLKSTYTRELLSENR